MKYILLLGLCLPACASTLDHQTELLLHPDSTVQAPALLGAAPGLIAGAPIWASVSLLAGSDSDATGYALHVFAYPGALLLAGLPWLVAGPSYLQPPPRSTPGRRSGHSVSLEVDVSAGRAATESPPDGGNPSASD